MDPRGLDYWIEGALPSEGGLGYHQKICVGKPYGYRMCISFGDAQDDCLFNCKGGIYDNSAGGPGPITDMYRYTSSTIDVEIETWFAALVGTDGPGSYSLIGNNCRNFSQNMFNTLNGAFNGGVKPLGHP